MKDTVVNLNGSRYRLIELRNGRKFIFFEFDPIGLIGDVSVYKVEDEYYLVNGCGEFSVVGQ